MFINKKSHKSAFVCIAVFMVTMIMILTFYQLAVEIYAYGFITKNNYYRVKEIGRASCRERVSKLV